MNSNHIVNSYLKRRDWRINENASTAFSYGAMSKYIEGEVYKDYWLNSVYPEQIRDAYTLGYMHIHDLGGLTLYCCGYSLAKILRMGVQGIPNVATSAPAKHFGSILNQLANLTTALQNEIMGAVAFSSFDTLLAPFIKKDNLTYEQVRQDLQNFIFSLNSNSRNGAEPAFTNLTFDITPPKDMLEQPVQLGGEYLDFTYGDCQAEMDMISQAYYELMLGGDYKKFPFTYPIPTYNMHKRFDWDNPKNEALWEMAGKYGYPYFANFINSDMNPEDARSMCCRLRLDLTELQRRNGGLFGSGDSTGSIGVVTLNLPKLAYLANGNEELFFELLDKYMEIAKDSLEIKRQFLLDEILQLDNYTLNADGTKSYHGLLPAFCTYVGTIDNHFSTIGVVGMNEMCENLFGEDIVTDRGRDFSVKVLEFMRERLLKYQEATGHLYNLEATPAESTCYRLARLDKKLHPDIITQENGGVPYYTNSCHMPVKKVENLLQLLTNQNDLQVQFTGGTVVHIYLSGPITGEQAKHIIKTVCTYYRVPYVSLSPLNGFCPVHGHLETVTEVCPYCGAKVELMQRITGYIRKVSLFNAGKKAEFRDRRQMVMKND